MSIVWRPTSQYVDKSNMRRLMRKHGIRTVEDLIKRSIDDIEWFWDAAAKDLNIEWFKPYEKVLDTSKGIEWARWFIGGRTQYRPQLRRPARKGEKRQDRRRVAR